MVRQATTRECARLFRHDAERRGQRFDRYKNKFPRGVALDVHGFHDNFTTSALTVVVTLSNVTAGDLLVCAVTVDNTSTPTITVADSLNGAWTAIGSIIRDTNQGQCLQLFFLPRSLAGSPVITATFSASSTFGMISAAGFLGMAGASPLDQNTGTFTIGTDPTTANVTTTADGELLFAACVGNYTSINTPTAGTGFTMIDSGTSTFMFDEWRLQTSQGSAAGTFTDPSSQQYAVALATFKVSINPNLLSGNDGPGQPAVQSVSY